MPRRPRLFLRGVPMHVIQRGNNRLACFFADDDYRFHLEWLAGPHGVELHALHRTQPFLSSCPNTLP